MPRGARRQWTGRLHHDNLLTMRPLLPVLLMFTLPGCDQIDNPGLVDAGPALPGGSTITRNVLLEDCTGFQCTNCPAAAAQADMLKGIYGDRLVVVGVHMGHFAEPTNGSNYTTDFRTPAGNEYRTTFGINFYPAGLISRVPYLGASGLAMGSWSSAVANLIDQPADMEVWLEPLTHNVADNTVAGTVKVAILGTVNGPHNLTLYLTEDHVVDWQLDGNTHVPDYDHRHVLRAALNGTWGEELIASSAQAGDTLELAFSYPLPANVLQPDNCSVVAYVYSTSGADQYEVKQVTERAFTP